MSAKASLALFFGLIPADIYNDLTYIRKIRNEFAHQHQTLDFSKPPVSDFVAHLIADKWFVRYLPYADNPVKPANVEEIRTKPRRAFEIAAAIVSVYLDAFVQSTQRPNSAANAFPFPEIK